MIIFKTVSLTVRVHKKQQWVSFIFGLLLICLHTTVIKAQDWPLGSNLPGTRLSVNPTQPFIALANEQAITILDSQDLTVVAELSPLSTFVADLEWSPDGQQLAVAAGYNIYIWQLDTASHSLQLLKTLAVANDSYDYDLGVTSIDWSPDQTQILGVDVPHALIWDITTSKVVETYEPSPDQIVIGAWSPDGNMIALGDIAGKLTIEHLDTQKIEIAHVPDAPAIFSLAWSPDSTAIAAGTSLGYQNDSIQFFTILPFLSTTLSINTESSEVISLDWNSTNPNLLGSGSFSGEVAVWDLHGAELLQQTQTGNPVASINWLNDDKELIYINDGIINKITADAQSPL